MGFLFLVLYPLLPPSFLPPVLPSSHTQYQHQASQPIHHSHTHTPLTHTHITHTHTSTHTHVITHTHTHHSHTHTHPTHNIIKHHIQYISHTHSLIIRGRMYAPVSLRCPSGVPPVFCVAGVRLGALQRGRMYAPGCFSGVPPVSLRCPSGVPPVSLRCPSGVPPVSLRCPLVSAALPVAFAWQARDLVHCMYQLSSLRLIACELLMACLFIVSAQVMMLVYGTWTTDMPRRKNLQSDGRIIYTYELKHTSSDYITISPYDHTHAQPRTHVHIHICTQTRTT